MTYCSHHAGKARAPFSFSPLYKELIGLVIPRVLGLTIPRTEKGVELIGSTTPEALGLIIPIPRMEKGVELIGSTPPGVLGLIIRRMEKGVAQIGLALCQKRFVERTQGSGLIFWTLQHVTSCSTRGR